MYTCTQVTSLHLCSLGRKCLVTFKRVLFSLSLGIPSLGWDLPSSVANEKIFTVKICDRPGTLGCYSWVLYRSFMGQTRSCRWQMQKSFKLSREWCLVVSQAFWNLIHCKCKSTFPTLNSMSRYCCREWKVWATSSSFWSYTVVVNMFKAIFFSAFITCYMFWIKTKIFL